jgi:hypothetical protein
MTGAATANITYLQDRWRPDTSSATKQSMQSVRRSNNETAQSVVIVEPSWEKSVWSRLKVLKNMPHGWDGTDDARPLDDFTSEFGMKLLQALLPPNAPAPQLSLLRYGGLQFEWFTHRCEFEIEVIGPYRAKAWLNDLENDEETEVIFEYNVTKLSRLIDKMLQLNPSIADAAAAA